MKQISCIFLAFSICAAFLACGCANYRLAGTPIKLPFSSVYVMPVKNTSYAPQAANLLTNQIVNALNQTPGLRTAYEGDAQAALQVAIVDYKLIPVATSEKDTALAASYKAQATAQCTLTRSNGEIIFKDKRVKADAMVYPYSNGENNLIGNQYQNMPVLMRELGNRIKDAVIGIW